jgi:threonyl-tRNA synthetase
VVGPRDEAAETISVRSRVEGDLGAMKLPEFVAKLAAESGS